MAETVDSNQWSLIFIIQGSYFTYLALLAAVFTSSSFRLTVKICFYMWSWSTGYGELLTPEDLVDDDERKTY